MEHPIIQELARLEGEIHQIAGWPFDIDDPTQLGEVLFVRLGLPGGARQEDGSWDVRSPLLERIEQDGHRIVALILDWRWAQIVRELLDEADGKPWAFIGFIQDYITSFGDYEIQQADGTTGRASELLADIARSAVDGDGAVDHKAMAILRQKARPATNVRGTGRQVH